MSNQLRQQTTDLFVKLAEKYSVLDYQKSDGENDRFYLGKLGDSKALFLVCPRIGRICVYFDKNERNLLTKNGFTLYEVNPSEESYDYKSYVYADRYDSFLKAVQKYLGRGNKEMSGYEDIILEDLNISVRSYNSLKRAGINTFSELLDVYENDALINIKNMGKSSCLEVKSVIEKVLASNISNEVVEKEVTVPDEVENAPIEELKLSVRLYHRLKVYGIETAGQLIRLSRTDLVSIKGLGSQCTNELLSVIQEIKDKGYSYIEERNPKSEMVLSEDYIIPLEIEDISVHKLSLETRYCNALVGSGFNTVGKLLRITTDEIKTISGLGSKGISEVLAVLQEIKEKGYAYFKERENTPLPNKRAIDTETVEELKEYYGFKTSWLSDWYGITRSRVQQIMVKTRNPGNWLVYEMTEVEEALLYKMIDESKDYIKTEEGIQVYLLNNRKDDCAVIFVSDELIKCFFMNMMSEELQEKIKDNKLDLLSREELEVLSSGKVSTILKQQYFFPPDSYRFRALAHERNMNTEEYCLFLTGMKLGMGQTTVDDEKIIEFLRSHYVNGKVMIPSNNSTVWFRSYIARHGYTIEEIVDLFGFGEDSNLDEEERILGTIAEDMLPHTIESDDWLDKLFAENPLIGNYNLNEKELELISSSSKEIVDRRLKDFHLKLSLKEEMQVALAVINYAKHWDTGDDSSFWKYITAQFGYRDETNQLRGILCDCILDAMRKNNRVFISTPTGYQYKSTIVIHALTTKRTWMLFFDFLFDFYKTNMQWTYIPDDPIIKRMVIALRSKLIAGENIDDDSIKISTSVYNFQEGISKLIIYRTGYSVKLVNHILRRIDSLVNHSEKNAEQYIDVLCDLWFENRLKNASEEKNHELKQTSVRNVAIDYNRIRPTYILQNERSVLISLPDIRLKKLDFGRVELNVFNGETIVDTKSLSYYGNELGKTLNGFTIDVNSCRRRSDGSLNIRIVLRCDEETIYDSENSLYRELLCFSGSKEYDVSECNQGSYSFFATRANTLELVGAEVSEIDTGNQWYAIFARLGPGFLIKYDDRIMAYDSDDETTTGRIKVICPPTESNMSFVKNGHKYSVVTKDSNLLIVLENKDDLKKYSVSMNAERLGLSDLLSEDIEKGYIFKLPLKYTSDGLCDMQIIDLQNNRIVSSHSFKQLLGLSVDFNREFYFSDDDFENAYVNIIDSHGLNKLDVNNGDELISYPISNGLIEIRIPRVIIRNSEGQRWLQGAVQWIKDIKKNEKIYVTLPSGCSCSLNLGNVDITEEGKGCFDYGNAAFAYSSAHDSDFIDLCVEITKEKTEQKYIIGRVSPIERFVDSVLFNYQDNTLFWNRGLGFVGNTNGNFMLRIKTAEGDINYPLNLDSEVIFSNSDLAHNEYQCLIVKESENIFMGDETVLYSGSLCIGDEDELRFNNNMIRIVCITYEEGENLRSVPISNTYIEQIVFQGIQFVDSEERECPVYSGVMFYMGMSKKHHNFSFKEYTSEEGFQYYSINPVQIVYINEHTLSITNEDGDGIYYYKHYDKNQFANIYSITDREPTPNNQDTYNLADLYTYRKERIN